MAGLPSGFGADDDEVSPPKVDHVHVKPRNRNPYSEIDWSRAVQINTTTHGHCENDAMLACYLKHRFGFFTISNYYPSAPTCPAAEATWPRGYPIGTNPVMVKGVLTPGPFDWRKIIRPWEAKIPEKVRQGFKISGKMFSSWPKGVLEAPNAEHHSFRRKDGSWFEGLHLCAPGSAYASGTFDAHDRMGTNSAGYFFGSGEYWGTAVDRMIAGLVFPDGGGVTINHPTWSNLKREEILELLDWDPRVLGIEVLENGENSEGYWDWVLATGRQCYGFFVPDWGYKNDAAFGVNVLVVPERTAHACLKAYRDGNFYGALRGMGELAFKKITFEGRSCVAETDRPARFEVITARGVVHSAEGTRLEWTCPLKKYLGNSVHHVYRRIRATALDKSGECLFTQAAFF